MSVIRCASNCDCKWSFLHSYVTNTRTAKDGQITETTFLVCNECKEWTGKPLRTCARGCRCHDEAGSDAMVVTTAEPLSVVEFS